MDERSFRLISDQEEIYYVKWIASSFLFCLFIHHVFSPRFFRRYNKIYREFSKEKRMEWDSRLVSSIHATTVSILCVSTLVNDKRIWMEPLTYCPTTGLIALSISIGYFLCDMVSMPIYWRGKQLLIFLLHHGVAVIAFQQVVHYRLCAFFGVYRLTTELSTPFINQRWFYRTIGYKPDRKRVLCVTLAFAVLFAVTRNFMILPFWYIARQSYNTSVYHHAKQTIPWLDLAFATPPLILDCLNIYWASKTYRIGWRAAKSIWQADWKTDIRLAQAKLRHKLRRIRRRGQPESLQSSVSAPVPTTLPTVETVLESYAFDSSSTSSYSSETEYEAAESDDGALIPDSTSDVLARPSAEDSQVTHRAH